MEAHEDLLIWAEDHGVTLNGIRPQRLPGRGFGIVATKSHEADEVLLQVPTKVLRSLHTVPKSISRKLPKVSVHAVLAADLALDESDKYSKWNAVLPTREDVKTMPLLWNAKLQDFLPRRGQEILAKQESKFKHHWEIVSKAFPSLTEEVYKYAWLLVNTRTFYYTDKKTEKLPKDDHMVLQPVADLFNHADTGCGVAYDTDGFTFTSKRAYAVGEEIHISYGGHSNDFLLVEYGFILGENRWDEVRIDEVILPELTNAQKEQLEYVSFLGNYVLDARDVCHRTQVALRIMCLPLGEWQDFVDGADDSTTKQAKVDQLLVKLLKKYEKTIKKTLTGIKGAKAGNEIQRQLLEDRWTQIQTLVEATVTRLSV